MTRMGARVGHRRHDVASRSVEVRLGMREAGVEKKKAEKSANYLPELLCFVQYYFLSPSNI